jgi:hypothetical protein
MPRRVNRQASDIQQAAARWRRDRPADARPPAKRSITNQPIPKEETGT